MKSRKIKAFEMAADVVKQFLTITVAILVITTTFSNHFFGSLSCLEKLMLVFCWFAFMASIVLGLFSLMKLTTYLEPDYEFKNPSIKGGIAAILALWQMILFLLALFILLILGVSFLFSN